MEHLLAFSRPKTQLVNPSIGFLSTDPVPHPHLDSFVLGAKSAAKRDAIMAIVLDKMKAFCRLSHKRSLRSVKSHGLVDPLLPLQTACHSD